MAGGGPLRVSSGEVSTKGVTLAQCTSRPGEKAGGVGRQRPVSFRPAQVGGQQEGKRGTSERTLEAAVI
jgi:hypothetical protein